MISEYPQNWEGRFCQSDVSPQEHIAHVNVISHKSHMGHTYVALRRTRPFSGHLRVKDYANTLATLFHLFFTDLILGAFTCKVLQ